MEYRQHRKKKDYTKKVLKNKLKNTFRVMGECCLLIFHKLIIKSETDKVYGKKEKTRFDFFSCNKERLTVKLSLSTRALPPSVIGSEYCC